MQVNVAGLRRNLKNIAHNYSDAQKKVREATSNDPWGPSSTLMAEIADLTYNVVAYTEIMQMIWKRLNDHGRNWRHVYKALVLLEYLIKTGSEKVGQQCKENIFAIQTLKDFQYLEEGKDQGQNVREKAKQLVNLLKDEERLRNERARALKAKERFAQTASGFGSDGGLDTPSSPRYPAFGGSGSLGDGWNSSRESAELPKELEFARPQTAGEEELQLQLALAMSREEAEQEEQKKRSDDVRLQLALSQSQQDFKDQQEQGKGKSHILDLLDVNLSSETSNADPWTVPQPPPRPQQVDPWNAGTAPSPPLTQSVPPPPPPADPWLPSAGVAPKADPWQPRTTTPAPTVPPAPRSDPWSPTSQSSSTDLDEFDAISNRNRSSPKTNGTVGSNNNTPDPFELNLLGESLSTSGPSPSTGATKKTPQSFLGDNAGLVNLDNLVTASKPTNNTNTNMANPFSDPQPPKPTINQIKQAPFNVPQLGTSAPTYGSQQPIGFTSAATGVYGNNSSFGTNNTQFGASMGNLGGPSQAGNDPWAPVSSNTNANLGAPWMKQGEQANPFLS
ncbi:hypothetical protein ILUMI_10513 [Ignelater luminosus]|uniref:ENTH domain-containing protein n=1 Tax=Ignelater luminosus TaxID=2038154 RepID=A0A8K0D094_IGNLU|nr:hypothetical protein ILUMI_10513 [Ignelater luminosus]